VPAWTCVLRLRLRLTGGCAAQRRAR
jgi:hypothetical protein